MEILCVRLSLFYKMNVFNKEPDIYINDIIKWRFHFDYFLEKELWKTNNFTLKYVEIDQNVEFDYSLDE